VGCATPPVPSWRVALRVRHNPHQWPMPYLHTKLGEGDVTLLGDAAHAQLPSLGLGVSTALGDIEELIAQVQSCSKYRMCSKQKHAVSTSTYLPADYY